MKKNLLAALLFVSTSAFAILPPHHQRNREIEAVLAHPELVEALHGEHVKEFFEQENGFLVRSENHEVFARVVIEEIQKIGPTEFHIEIK